MASVIDICNLALAHLTHNAEVTSIDPPDGSTEAAYCKRFFAIARDTALELHEWGFATRRIALAEVGTPPDGWVYQYAMPTNCIRPLQIFETGSDPLLDPEGAAYEIESDDTHGTVILTNVEDASLRYTHRITDTTKYTPLCVLSMSWALASLLAGPVTQDDKRAEFCRRMAASVAGSAGASDANSRKAATQNSIHRNYPINRPRRSTLTDGSST